ncbi:ALF repeat-containing protein [Streptomyces sp. NPDC008121]|uniref:ALF repeat-containing protein n=1 Tax=Streptomyces sp. NPDC008121 TaxID=3364809 RepID=UPI0036E55AD0
MRPTRAALTAAALVLTPALLLAAPASAAAGGPGAGVTAVARTGGPDTPVSEMSDDDVRVAILRIIGDPATGRSVRDRAQAAMDGTAEDRRYFLETGRWAAKEIDDRVEVFRILAAAGSNGDRAVVREATKALQAGTAQALRGFLESGHRLARAEDDAVALFRLLADPALAPALRAEAEQALEEGTPEALRSFWERRR